MSEKIFNPTLVQTEQDEAWKLGERARDNLGNEYLYVKATAAVVLGKVVRVNYQFNAAHVTTGNSAAGRIFGVAVAAMAANTYGWVQIYGRASIHVLASCAKDKALYTSGTAGSLDDASNNQTKITGAVLGTAQGGAAGVNDNAQINYPSRG